MGAVLASMPLLLLHGLCGQRTRGQHSLVFYDHKDYAAAIDSALEQGHTHSGAHGAGVSK